MTDKKWMVENNCNLYSDDKQARKNQVEHQEEAKVQQRYEAILELKRVTEHNRANYARRNKWADVAKCDDILQKLEELPEALWSVILKDP